MLLTHIESDSYPIINRECLSDKKLLKKLLKYKNPKI